MEPWGGAWTVDKLDRVEKYLNAFVTLMKNQKFRLVYIDAFCGSGEVHIKGADELPLLQEGRQFLAGSAKRALLLPTPFDQYYFIDASAGSLAELKKWLNHNRPDLEQRVSFCSGDVNLELPKVTASLGKMDRAVLFLDPFGMQVDWSTMEKVSKSIVDMWYLVPTMALNRLVMDKLTMSDSLRDKLTKFLGTDTWHDTWYADDVQGNLFEEFDEAKVRAVTMRRIETDFIQRLKKLFNMADNSARFKNKKNSVVFTLVFGCSNKNPNAYGKALRIANHLLKD